MLKLDYPAILILSLLVLGFGGILSYFFLFLAKFFKIYDDPFLAPNRKEQNNPIPLIGGLSIILNALFFSGLLYFFTSFSSDQNTNYTILQSIFSGSSTTFFNLNLEGFQNSLKSEFQSDFLLYKINFLGVLVGLLIVAIAGFFDDLGIFDRPTNIKLAQQKTTKNHLPKISTPSLSITPDSGPRLSFQQCDGLKAGESQQTNSQTVQANKIDVTEPDSEFEAEIKADQNSQTNSQTSGLQTVWQGQIIQIPKISKLYYFLALFVGILCIVIWGNLQIEVLSYPFDYINFSGFGSYILPVFWLGFCLMTTKFIDGSDGLCSSIALVCFLTIASTSAMNHINQPFTFCLSLIWAFSCIPFLYQNFPNARQYLGESGSTVLGLSVGILSILSGAKVATTSMVLGWFLWDILLVIISRSIIYKSFKKGLTQGDNTSHWHHRLKKMGMNKLQVLVFTLILILIFAQISLFSGAFYPAFTGSYLKLLPLVFQFSWLTLIFYLKTKKSLQDYDLKSKK